jgi:hypothetical protein
VSRQKENGHRVLITPNDPARQLSVVAATGTTADEGLRLAGWLAGGWPGGS